MASKDRGEELQDQHNKGEQDGAKGNYHPPSNPSPLDHMAYTQETIDKMNDERESYDKGYENGRNNR